MKTFLALIALIMTCSSCAVLLIGSVGEDTVGYIYRDGDTYSGTVNLKERNSGFGFGGDLQESENIVEMEVTNVNEFPIDLYTRSRPMVDRDSATYKLVRVPPGETVVGYRGVAMGLSCSHENSEPMKLKITVRGLNNYMKAHSLSAKSSWGVGP